MLHIQVIDSYIHLFGRFQENSQLLQCLYCSVVTRFSITGRVYLDQLLSKFLFLQMALEIV